MPTSCRMLGTGVWWLICIDLHCDLHDVARRKGHSSCLLHVYIGHDFRLGLEINRGKFLCTKVALYTVHTYKV